MKGRLLLGVIVAFVCFVSLGACKSPSSDTIDDVQDVVGGVDRKPLPKNVLGVNAFFNSSRFGSIDQQYSEIRDTLGRRYIRVLFDWNDGIQSSPSARPDFGLYDAIVSNAPSGIDLLVVLTDVPSWMSDSGNWIDGNPRRTFAERWVKPVLNRYGSNSRIVGWEIWNEPNMPNRRDNSTLGLTDSPENFLELMAFASNVCKEIAPGKLVLNGATTAINQNYPETIRYNRALRDGGIENLIDRFAIHYYGKQYENVVRSGGVRDLLEGFNVPIWITESGTQGVNNQLAYGEEVWPYLLDKLPNVERIYIYQMYENTPAESTYALRNTTEGSSLSDLYIALQSRD